jgi:hypothetical protein
MPMMRRKRLRSSFWRAVSDLGAKQEFGMPKDPFIREKFTTPRPSLRRFWMGGSRRR